MRDHDAKAKRVEKELRMEIEKLQDDAKQKKVQEDARQKKLQ